MKKLVPVLPFIAFNLSTVLSVFLMELGAFSSELGQFGFATGGGFRLLLFMAISIVIFYFIQLILKPKFEYTNSPTKDKIIVIWFITLICAYTIPLLVYGPPVLTGKNRYEFAELPLANYLNIKLIISIACFFLSFVASSRGKLRSSAWKLFILSLVLMVLWGEKMSGPFNAIIYFATGYLLNSDIKINVGKALFVSLSLIVVILSFYLVWGLISGLSTELILFSFLDRGARQGQAYWKLDMLANIDNVVFTKGVLENMNFYDYSASNVLGNRYVKNQILNPDLFGIHTGSFAAVYPAILYLNNSFTEFLGYGAMFEIIYWIVIVIFFYYSHRGPFIYLMPFLCSWFAVHLRIYQSGNIYLLTHYNYILGIALFIILFLRYRYWNNDIKAD